MISSDEKKILTLIKLLPLSIIIFSIFITYIVISNNNIKFEQEIINLKTDSINKTKEQIKYEVERAYRYISNEEKTTIDTLKINIKNRVNEAYKIAYSIYKHNKDKPKHIVSIMIKDALREIRFNKGRGYFFIYDLEGVNIMHPILKKIEGKNLINIKDNRGMYVIKETINLVKEKKEGFLKWWWSKPKDIKNEYEKIGFAKHFEPFNWFIGTGEYINDFEKELQNKILNEIQKIQLNNNGYIFVVDNNSVILSHLNKKLIGKKPLSELTNLLNKALLKEPKGSGFLEYVYSKPTTGVYSTKISFIKEFKTWNWIIGTGTQGSDINKIIERKKKDLEIKNEEQMYSIFVISFIISVVLFFISIIFSNIIKRKFIRYKRNVEKQAKKLKSLNQSLEQKVEKRTKSLTKQTNTITDLLNNASQGFLSFDKDFLIDGKYSLECEHLLGKNLHEKDITELLFSDELDKKSFFKETIIDALEEKNELTSSLLLSLLPSEMVINKRVVLIEYKILSDNKIMMIITNITDKIKLKSKIKAEQNILKMIVATVSDSSHFYETKENFEEFCDGYSLFINEDYTPLDNVNTINALIHTFKGLFAQLYMKDTVKHLHNLETDLFNFKESKKTNEDLANLLESYELKRCMDKDLKIMMHILGEKFLEEYNLLKVDEKIINKLEDKILSISLLYNEQKEEWEEILYDIKKIKNKSLYHYLSVYPNLSQQLTISLNKSIHPFEIIGDENIFTPDNFKPFINSLIHVFRNCCDHGIETKEKRIELHKNETGNINCEFKKIDNTLSIIISDDGQGIDIDRLKEKILKKKLCSRKELESFSINNIINFIFNSNLSTNDNVTQISGRGIGLSAVYFELTKLNGIVEVKTKINEGTKFIFTIPLDLHLINTKEQCSIDFYNDLYTKHKVLLKYIAQGKPLPFILDEIIKSVESRNQNMICSILVLDKTKQKLLKGAAPSLPSYYNDAINGTLIGEKVGSCGAAAFLKERVIVENINTHENWKFAKKLANKANLHACWSQPLFSSENEIIGTFAIYYNEPKKPSDFDVFLIEDIASITAIALEKYGYIISEEVKDKKY